MFPCNVYRNCQVCMPFDLFTMLYSVHIISRMDLLYGLKWVGFYHSFSLEKALHDCLSSLLLEHILQTVIVFAYGNSTSCWSQFCSPVNDFSSQFVSEQPSTFTLQFSWNDCSILGVENSIVLFALWHPVKSVQVAERSEAEARADNNVHLLFFFFETNNVHLLQQCCGYIGLGHCFFFFEGVWDIADNTRCGVPVFVS